MKYIIIFLSLYLAQVSSAQDYPETLPDFKVFTLEGDFFTKDDLKKDKYALFIYFNPDCGHCQTTFKTLNLKAEQIKGADVVLYPISTNTVQKTTAFFDIFSPKINALDNIKILRDDDFKFADAFFVGGYPTSYLYDKNNKLVKVYNGSAEVMLFLNDLN